MRSALPLAVCAAGCDLVYGLGDRVDPAADAALVDGADALDVDGPSCTPASATVVAQAETMLIREQDGNCDPSNRYGTYINVNLGQSASAGTRSRVLQRFTLTTDMIAALAPDGGFTEATLVLPLKPNACAAPCPSSATSFAIYAANNDWNEGETTGHIGANWCMRKQLSPSTPIMWSVHGADGATDRSAMPLAEVTVSAVEAQNEQLILRLTPSAAAIEDARTWLAGQQLSLIFIPTSSTGTLFLKAHEDADGGGAQLTIKSCR